jgi:sugar O-acyltransferase (sialic acid O-acetyltransferase NeuD family)
MFLFGAGGHAKVIADTLTENNVEIKGIYDDNPSIASFGNYRFLGFADKLQKNQTLIIGVGNNAHRKQIANRLDVNYGQAISKYSTISLLATIGKGSVVMRGVSINADAKILSHVILNTNCSIDHDCTVSDFVHIAPGAILCGNVFVGEGTLLGAGAIVLPNIKIGKWCTIGAGSVVTKDIPDNMTVCGAPAKAFRHEVYTNKLQKIIMWGETT